MMESDREKSLEVVKPSKTSGVEEAEVEVGFFYQIDKWWLPQGSPHTLSTVHLVLVCEKTEQSVLVKYPSAPSVFEFFRLMEPIKFKKFGPEGGKEYPTLDKEWELELNVACKFFVRKISLEEFAERRTSLRLWSLSLPDHDTLTEGMEEIQEEIPQRIACRPRYFLKGESEEEESEEESKLELGQMKQQILEEMAQMKQQILEEMAQMKQPLLEEIAQMKKEFLQELAQVRSAMEESASMKQHQECAVASKDSCLTNYDNLAMDFPDSLHASMDKYQSLMEMKVKIDQELLKISHSLKKGMKDEEMGEETSRINRRR